MTDLASAPPSAGWYDDPADSARLRWWDGAGWTERAMRRGESALADADGSERLATVTPITAALAPPPVGALPATIPTSPSFSPAAPVTSDPQSDVPPTAVPMDVTGLSLPAPQPPDPTAPIRQLALAPDAPEVAAREAGTAETSTEEQLTALLAQRMAELGAGRSEVAPAPVAAPTPPPSDMTMFFPGQSVSGPRINPLLGLSGPEALAALGELPLATAMVEPGAPVTKAPRRREKPVREPKPPREKAVREPKPPREKAVREPKPPREKAVREPKPIREKAVREPKPIREKPVREPKPIREKAVREPKPPREKAVRRPKPIREKVVREPRTTRPFAGLLARRSPEPTIAVEAIGVAPEVVESAPVTPAAASTPMPRPEPIAPAAVAERVAVVAEPLSIPEERAPAEVTAPSAPSPIPSPAPTAAAPIPAAPPTGPPTAAPAPHARRAAVPAPAQQARAAQASTMAAAPAPAAPRPAPAPTSTPVGRPLRSAPPSGPAMRAATPRPPMPTPAAALAPGSIIQPLAPPTPTPSPVLGAVASVASRGAWWSDLLPRTSNTVGAWLLAFVPIGTVVAAGAVGWIAVAHPRWTLLALGIAAVGVVLVPIFLVANDHSRLHALGWERQPRSLSILLGSVTYLLSRQAALGRQGARVLPLLIASIALALIGAAGLVGGAIYAQDHLQTWLDAARTYLML